MWQHTLIDILSRHKSAKYQSCWIRNNHFMHNLIQWPRRIKHEKTAHLHPLDTFSAFHFIYFWMAVTPELFKTSSSNFQHFLVLWRPQNVWNFKVLGAQVLKLVSYGRALLRKYYKTGQKCPSVWFNKCHSFFSADPSFVQCSRDPSWSHTIRGALSTTRGGVSWETIHTDVSL